MTLDPHAARRGDVGPGIACANRIDLDSGDPPVYSVLPCDRPAGHDGPHGFGPLWWEIEAVEQDATCCDRHTLTGWTCSLATHHAGPHRAIRPGGIGDYWWNEGDGPGMADHQVHALRQLAEDVEATWSRAEIR